MTRTVQAVAALTAIYLLALGSVKPADVATGAVVAAAALAVARRAPGRQPAGLRSLPALPRLLVAVFVDVARGTWEVAQVVLGVGPERTPAIVEIPIGDRTPGGAVVSALISTLSPGEVLLDVDLERGVYVIHALDAGDQDAVRARHRRGYERYQRGVLP